MVRKYARATDAELQKIERLEREKAHYKNKFEIADKEMIARGVEITDMGRLLEDTNGLFVGEALEELLYKLLLVYGRYVDRNIEKGGHR